MDIGYNITIENFQGTNIKNKLFARQMIWEKDKMEWRLKAWNKRVFYSSGEIITNGPELDTTLLVSPSDFDNKYGLSETLTMKELNDFIKLQEMRSSDDIKFYKIEKYIRYAQPFTVIILVILGVIIASKRTRQGTGYLIALGFLFAFIFIIFFVMSRALAENGSINSLIAIWLQNILFGLLTYYMYIIIPK